MKLQLLRLGLSSGLLRPPLGSGAPIAASALSPQHKQQSRGIVTKDNLELPDDYPEPWPYQEKGTNKRLHKNSKLIVLEGNIGAGKSTVGPKLADILGFRYMPEFSMDHILIDRYGYDMRDFYPLFPKRFRMPDINMFYRDPFDDMSAAMQDRIYFSRHEQYCNALAHIFNTGQGVVLERPVHSDFVFVNAMRKKNYISREYFRHYYFTRKVTLPPLNLWPHLVIYLDTSVDKCLENIRNRGNVDEMAVVDADYLQTIEDSYKDALREYKRHSKVFVYDWSTPGDVDRIIEQIEETNFDFFEYHVSDHFLEWHVHRDEVYASLLRMNYTEKHNGRVGCFDDIQKHEVGELYIDPQDAAHFKKVMMHEVLKDRCTYGMTHMDPPESKWKVMNMWKGNQILPEKWFEYYFREVYYAGLINGTTDLFDPMGTGYDPDFLHRHHA